MPPWCGEVEEVGHGETSSEESKRVFSRIGGS